MKRKYILLLIVSAFILLLPKNSFAKTLEVNYPANYMSYQELMSTCTLRESEFFNIGSTSSGQILIANPATQQNVLGAETMNDKIKFYILDGVTASDLTSNITQQMRDHSIDTYGVDLFKDYDKITINVKELNSNIKSDIVIDFTKYNELFDLNAYDATVLSFINRQNLEETNSPFTSSTSLAGVNGGNENYDEIISRDGKSLVKIYYENSTTPFQIKIQEGVTYKDNIEYVLDDSIKAALLDEGVNVNKLVLKFGDKPVSNVNKVINNIKNPETYNNLLIVFIVSFGSLLGYNLVKRIKSN